MSHAAPVLTIGLTGGIGSGKSAVAHAFAALGVEVVDADDLAHRLTRPGAPGYRAVVERFGSAFLSSTGEIDRAALRELVFADDASRRELESMLHPMIGAEMRDAIARWRGAYGIAVVPLLLERGGVRGAVDRVLVVDCPEDEQVRRVMARSGMTPAQVHAIMATQLPRKARLACADDILDNGGDLYAIAPQVLRLDARYRELARERGTTRANDMASHGHA